LRDVTDDDIEREDEITRVPLLPHPTIDPRFHADAGPRINFIRYQRTHRAEGVKTLGSSPLAVFVLQVTGGDVVHAGIAKYVIPNVFLRRGLVASLAHDDAQFALIIHALRNLGPQHRPTGRQ